MTRRSPRLPRAFFAADDGRGEWTVREHARRPIAAAERDRRPLEFEADRRGTWMMREHSQLKRQWRWVRRAPVIVQIIIGLLALTWFTVCFFATWLVVGGLTMPHP